MQKAPKSFESRAIRSLATLRSLQSFDHGFCKCGPDLFLLCSLSERLTRKTNHRPDPMHFASYRDNFYLGHNILEKAEADRSDGKICTLGLRIRKVGLDQQSFDLHPMSGNFPSIDARLLRNDLRLLWKTVVHGWLDRYLDRRKLRPGLLHSREENFPKILRPQRDSDEPVAVN